MKLFIKVYTYLYYARLCLRLQLKVFIYTFRDRKTNNNTPAPKVHANIGAALCVITSMPPVFVAPMCVFGGMKRVV